MPAKQYKECASQQQFIERMSADKALNKMGVDVLTRLLMRTFDFAKPCNYARVRARTGPMKGCYYKAKQ